MANREYTVEQMREMADCIGNIKQSEMSSWREGEIITGGDLCRAAEMLRQAADAEEELAHLHDEQIRLVAENARLAARLHAVVKIAGDNLWCEDSGVVETDTCAKLHNSYMSDILRVARGDGGAE